MSENNCFIYAIFLVIGLFIKRLTDSLVCFFEPRAVVFFSAAFLVVAFLVLDFLVVVLASLGLASLTTSFGFSNSSTTGTTQLLQ